MEKQILSITDHRRDSAGLKYVYPVMSRRAGGVSVGINLNVNRACNWACVYCQVDGLTKGGPPPVDLLLLKQELSGFLTRTLKDARGATALVDIAFSGDGEPTSAPDFYEAVCLVLEVLDSFNLLGSLPVRLITNGSLMHRPEVKKALQALATGGGEVWFKVDRADSEDMKKINKSQISPAQVLNNLRACARIIPTWIQTCWFSWDGKLPDTATKAAYLELIAQVASIIQGVHLYGIARPSMQPERDRLGRVGAEEMNDWATEVQERTGIRVTVSP